MKNLLFTLPALALMTTTAFAQSDTTQTETTTETGTTEGMTGADAGSGMMGESYGTNWPLSVGTTFFTDGESSTLRSTEELGSGWQSLSQEDRDMILADCDTFMAVHGGSASGDAATTSTGTESGTDTSTTTASESPASGDAATTSTDGSTTTAATGYDMDRMSAICGAAQKF